MTRRPLPYLAAGFLGVALLLARAAVAPELAMAAEPTSAASDPNRPRILYRQAESAFKARNFNEARQLLLEAWKIRRTYDVAAALGQAEIELELYRDAAEHLDFAVQNFAPMESERLLEETKNDLRAAKSQIAEARINTEPHATIYINGESVGEAPLPAGIFLAPGSYAFEASVGQDRKAAKQLVLQKGGTYEIELKLPASVPSPASGLDAPSPAAPRRASYVPSAIAATVGGVAAVTGVALLVAAAAKDSDRENLQSTLDGTNVCGAGRTAGPQCDDISTLAWSASHYRTGAIVAFGTAVGAGVVTYLLWPRAARERAMFVIAPSYSHDAHSFDLSATGRF